MPLAQVQEWIGGLARQRESSFRVRQHPYGVGHRSHLASVLRADGIILIAASLAGVVLMSRVRHVVRWRPVGAAATFLLAAVAGVVGSQLTGHLTPAVVAFAALLVAGMAVTFLLERKADGQASGDDQSSGTADEGPGRSDLRGARGVQVGDNNRQVNYFGTQAEAERRE